MRIIVEGVGGVKISSEERYEKWLARNGRQCLLDSDGDQIDFGFLVEGGSYTLGPPIQQQLDNRPPLHPNTMIDVKALADEIAENLRLNNSWPTTTPATRGREELAALRFSKSISQAQLDSTLPPILTPDALAQLTKDFDAAKSSSPKVSPLEAALTALLTPLVLCKKLLIKRSLGLSSVILNTFSGYRPHHILPRMNGRNMIYSRLILPCWSPESETEVKVLSNFEANMESIATLAVSKRTSTQSTWCRRCGRENVILGTCMKHWVKW